MDILDEIDAAIHEKRSKWNYTPMREKNETDAIIDELLREFSPGSSSHNNRAYQDRPQSVKTADKISEEPSEYSPAAENDDYTPPANYNDEYNEYIARKYASSEYEDDDEYDEYDDGEYDEDEYDDGEYDEDEYDDDEYADDEYDEDEYDDDEYADDEYDEEDYPEKNGGGKSRNDFESFMDSENDGEKGDLPDFRISSLIKTILKIAVLAAFGAFAVAGVISTVGNFMNKFGSHAESSSNQDNLKNKLQSVIYPLIVTETGDFENISELTDEDYVNIGVWELVINGDKSVFKDKDSDDYLLPQEQMTYIIEKLFGEDTEFSHTSAGLKDTAIIYDKKNKQYIIPEDTDLYTYYPVVTDIAEAGDKYTVYANCFISSPSWQSGKSDPSRRVMITLEKTSEYYNIKSLKTIPVE